MPNPNHPRKGANLRSEPIKDLKDIAKIKHNLRDKPRDLCLFNLGINTGYRANEILKITVGQVQYLKANDRLEVWQSKNKKYRTANLNPTVIRSIRSWLAVHPDADNPDAPLFWSRRTRKALTVETVIAMVKSWCLEAGLRGQYASHSLRKTWGYQQRVKFDTPTAVLTRAYGHSHESQTLQYICVQQKEVEVAFANEI